jgi:hypothetical protein
MVFPGQIFTKLETAQQHYVQISCNEFQPNWVKSVENTERKPFTSICKARISLR